MAIDEALLARNLILDMLTELDDTDFARLIDDANKAREKETVLGYDQRVRFADTVSPKRLRGATGRVVDKSFTGGAWKYKIHLDVSGETFIRVPRTSLIKIDNAAPVVKSGAKKAPANGYY